MPNSPINAIGTAHSGIVRALKPSSSSGFISAGIRGSVDALIIIITVATVKPSLLSLKYGTMRAMRCLNVAAAAGGATGAATFGAGSTRSGSGSAGSAPVPARGRPVGCDDGWELLISRRLSAGSRHALPKPARRASSAAYNRLPAALGRLECPAQI